MPCGYYPPADLDDLEEAATQATPEQQREALQVVADIFNAHQLPYGLMGGMNFYLRGSGRTTDDADLAVTGTQSLQATLDLLNEEEWLVLACVFHLFRSLPISYWQIWLHVYARWWHHSALTATCSSQKV